LSELDTRIEALTASVTTLAEQVQGKADMPKDRYDSIKAELAAQSESLEEVLEEKRQTEISGDLEALKARMDEAFRPASKAAAILAGASGSQVSDEAPFGTFLKALWVANKYPSPSNWAAFEQIAGPDAMKATVGDTDANGGYIIPNNFVAQVVEICQGRNIYRQIMNVVPGVRGNGVDIPYELDDSSLQRAQGQGGESRSYGSNKDTRDFTLGSATANLFPLARIIDVGNQLLRYSEGAAERLVRNKLATAFWKGEAYYILSGTGANNQPNGILTSLAAASSTYSTALSSETRAAAIGRGLGALESRACDATAVVMTPTDWWELAVETLGSSGSGGWALAPGDGPQVNASQRSFPLWGVPVFRDNSGFLTTGTALIAAWNDIDLFFGQDYRIDVSDEAGTRFDRNVTGFRAEEEIAFNADPYVLTGKVQRVTGL
jgi:HK97 family phage major capsid protein